MMNKFIVVDCFKAKDKKYPYADQYDDWCNLLYETDWQKPIRLIASDNGEIEDKIFTRDFSWVVDELNKQAGIISSLENQISILEEEKQNLIIELSESNERD